jgi:hypothetical protein
MSDTYNINTFKETIDLSFSELSEGATTIYNSLDEIIVDIQKDCKSFLKHKQLIFRGMHLDSQPSGLKKVRKDRESRDSSTEYTKFLDDLHKKIKIPLRSQAMFAITVPSSQYGDPYMVFPKGNFKFAWIDHIHDLWAGDPMELEMEADLDEIAELLSGTGDPIKRLDMIIELVAGIVNSNPTLRLAKSTLKTLRDLRLLKVNTTKFPTTNKVGGAHLEIIIGCDEYYFIRWNHENEAIVKNALGLK